MRKVFLRADGNSEIGMGHITRTMALVSMLSKDFDCTLFTQFQHSKIEEECKREGIKWQFLGSNHQMEFISFLKGTEIVVLDNYYFDTNYQAEIKSKGCKLVSIDDIHTCYFVSDLVINHSPAAKETDYSYSSSTRLLLGLEYVLLRKAFLRKSEGNKLLNKSINKIFLCFGGSDFKNLTKRYLEDLTLKTNFFVNVVVGPAYNHVATIESFKSHPRVSIFQALNQEEISKIIELSDLAIVPSSGILFECIALNTRFITGYYADNQMEIAKYFSLKNSNVSIGDMSKASINDHLKKLESRPYPMELVSLIDGRSDERILNEFKNLKWY